MKNKWDCHNGMAVSDHSFTSNLLGFMLMMLSNVPGSISVLGRIALVKLVKSFRT